MATINPASIPIKCSPEEVEQLIRDICIHGATNAEIQEAIDNYLIPNADQILSLPKTTQFTDIKASGPVVGWALKQKCYPLLRYLLHNGWGVRLAHEWTPFTPTLLASRVVLRDFELTRFLLNAGIDPRVGDTPKPNRRAQSCGSKGWLLYMASMFSSLETFVLLQSHGANLSHSHSLHGAATEGPSQIPIIRHLLDSKAVDVDELDVYHAPHQGTALLAAISKGHVEVVKVLLEYGAHPLACIHSPYEIDAVGRAKCLVMTDEEAPKEILRMLEEAIEKRRAEGRLGNVPVTGERNNSLDKSRLFVADSTAGVASTSSTSNES